MKITSQIYNLMSFTQTRKGLNEKPVKRLTRIIIEQNWKTRTIMKQKLINQKLETVD